MISRALKIPGLFRKAFNPPAAKGRLLAQGLFGLMLALSLAINAVSAQPSDSESVRISSPLLYQTSDNELAVDAQVEVVLSSVLIDAVARGVPLYFVTEFELSKTRWYWFDRRLAAHAKTVRISYHALTQQYRLAVGGLHQAGFFTLKEAFQAALNLRGWRVVSEEGSAALPLPIEMFKPGAGFEARLRVRLDSALLPKPLQLNALTSRDWNLSSDWISLRFQPLTEGTP
jgi:hypothetical protein